ncbi:MAG: hypothetical protein EBV75_04235 [Acidimicrobiia bacterium]|nr:hypothetical protein [Acidimicrobiia bacterium]
MNKFRKPVVAIALALVGSLSTGSIALTVEFNKATGHNVSYANPGGGSTKGKSDFKAGLTDFGGTDSAVTSTQAASFDWVYVPYVAGSISIAYRLDEIKGTTLSLSPATINGIFGGTITKWNDPSIVNDMKTNPAWANSLKKSALKGASSIWSTPSLNTALVTVTLTPAVLKSSKGKTVELYDNTKKKSVKTATIGAKGGSAFQGQSGSANVSNYISDTNGSIGYTEVSFVTDATRAAKGMQSANVKNAAGKFVGPTAAGASAFVAGATIDAVGFVTFDYKQATNTAAYPIVAVTYGLGKTAKSAKNAVVSDFFSWILSTYAPASADALGYAPLTGAMLTAATAQAKKINSK